MRARTWFARVSELVAGAALLLGAAEPSSAQAPAGEVTLPFHVTLAPTWLDPSAAPPQITPLGVLYAPHDALVRPLPGQTMASSLAESWTESPDGLVDEFKLRRGLAFHNGDHVTADDVKFSFERYAGAGGREIRASVRRVEIVDPLTEAQRQALAQQCQALDPIALARDIQLTLDLLWKLADTRPRREAAHR